MRTWSDDNGSRTKVWTVFAVRSWMSYMTAHYSGMGSFRWVCPLPLPANIIILLEKKVTKSTSLENVWNINVNMSENITHPSLYQELKYVRSCLYVGLKSMAHFQICGRILRFPNWGKFKLHQICGRFSAIVKRTSRRLHFQLLCCDSVTYNFHKSDVGSCFETCFWLVVSYLHCITIK